jgi:hypothetical protein
MTWTEAIFVGLGLGLICFGGLWLKVRRLRPDRPALLGLSSAARLALVGLTFVGLGRAGPDLLLAGLGGLWLGRWCVLRQVGGRGHGR